MPMNAAWSERIDLPDPVEFEDFEVRYLPPETRKFTDLHYELTQIGDSDTYYLSEGEVTTLIEDLRALVRQGREHNERFG